MDGMDSGFLRKDIGDLGEKGNDLSLSQSASGLERGDPGVNGVVHV
jgi:hypothetical protein